MGLLDNGPDAMGWAVGAGLMFNLPWAQGDQLWVQGTYAKGAASYLGFNKFVGNDAVAMFSGDAPLLGGNGSLGLGWAFDGIFQTGTEVALTEGFQVNAALQHYWTPSLRTSVFGGYVELNFGANGVPGSAATLFCTGLLVAGAITVATGPGVVIFSPLTTCDPSFALWQAGTRTIWSPVRNLDIGVEALYTRFDQNMVGGWNLSNTGARTAGVYAARDQETWSGLIRFQRNFWP